MSPRELPYVYSLPDHSYFLPVSPFRQVANDAVFLTGEIAPDLAVVRDAALGNFCASRLFSTHARWRIVFGFNSVPFTNGKA